MIYFIDDKAGKANKVCLARGSYKLGELRDYLSFYFSGRRESKAAQF